MRVVVIVNIRMKNVSIIITVGHFVCDGDRRGGANNVGTIIVIEVASN